MPCCDECDVTKLLETLREDPVIAHGLEVAPVQTIRSLPEVSLAERRMLLATVRDGTVTPPALETGRVPLPIDVDVAYKQPPLIPPYETAPPLPTFPLRPKVRTAKPDLGVIRWDGHIRNRFPYFSQLRERWAYSKPSAVGRVPFCGYYTPYREGEPFVAMNCDSQEVAELENAYAAWAGINFWVFAQYPDGSGLEAGLENYDIARNNDIVQHAIIIGETGYEEALRARTGHLYIDKLIARMRQPNYKYVQIQGKLRPLVFVIGGICNFEPQYSPATNEPCPPVKGWSGPPGCDYCSPWLFDEIRKRMAPVEPYFVYIGTDPRTDQFFFRQLRLDAISQYAVGVQPKDADYLSYAARIRFDVNDQLSTIALQEMGRDFVAFASTGWDPRPRFECGPFCYSKLYGSAQTAVSPGSAEAVAKHVQSVAGYAAHFFSTTLLSPANAVLVYSWNEQSEGPGLMPTIWPDGTPTGFLDISRIAWMQALFNP